MSNLKITSQITFLYFENYDYALTFLKNILELELVFNPGWAAVFRTGENAFIGAVDAKKSSIELGEQGGTLISLTVDDLDSWFQKLKKVKDLNLSEIKSFEDIHLKSFFFKGPEGYDFEIQEFQNDELRKLF